MSGRRCRLDRQCGRHGACLRGLCACALAFSGPLCDAPRPLPPSSPGATQRPGPASLAFEGPITLTRGGVRQRQRLSVALPDGQPPGGGRSAAGGPVEEGPLRLRPGEILIYPGGARSGSPRSGAAARRLELGEATPAVLAQAR